MLYYSSKDGDSMYNLTTEYKTLLERKNLIETSLETLAKGYISRKTIKGKQYSYLQTKVDGKLTSEYLKAEDIDRISEELALRKKYEAELPMIIARLEELENAASIIGNGVDRTLMLLRISSGMDTLQPAEKERCISFANAMNAVEGVPVSKQTADDIARWQNGVISYQAVFAATLKRYGFAVEV